MMAFDKFNAISGELVVGVALEHQLSEGFVHHHFQLFQPYLDFAFGCDVALVQL